MGAERADGHRTGSGSDAPMTEIVHAGTTWRFDDAFL